MDKNTLPQKSTKVPEMTKPWEGRGCKGIAQDAAFYGLTAVAAVGIIKAAPIFVPAWAIVNGVVVNCLSKLVSMEEVRPRRKHSYFGTELYSLLGESYWNMLI
jgi:hypothetical protein